MARRFWSALVVLCFVVVGLVAQPLSSSATTPSYNNIEFAPELYVYTDGSVKTQALDISTTWWADIKQAYQRRTTHNPSGWPTNFISTVDDAVANGGSMGVVLVESYYGTEIRMFASDDPNVSCRMQTYGSEWWLECYGSTPGYSFASADYITHNSYGNNGCGGGSCSDNGLNIYNAPTVFPAGGGSWGLDGSLLGSGQAKIFFLNADMVYPTDYTGDPIPREFSPLEYVALGDSFSSGEGVEPFESGTDVSDDPSTSGVDEENRCHRSEYAYPRLLADDPRLGLQLTDFVACSSATTSTVQNGGTGIGSWSEGAQLGALSDETDVVTITIGGNDVAFKEYVEACAGAFCGPLTSPLIHNAMMDGINAPAFKVNLVTTYESIIEEAPNAKVYVIGYPMLTLPTQTFCESLDATGAYPVVNAINSAIASAVSEVKLNSDNIYYVDSNLVGSAFEGGHLCGYTPMFNGLDAFNIEYSYHPNAIGQFAYYSVAKEGMN